jgi:hypothetical protein
MSIPQDDILSSTRREFASLRQLAERAMTQVDDEAFFRTLGDDENSVGLLAKHIGGNLRSRWTEIFTTDGEKPDRNRDGEFQRGDGDTRERVTATWQSGWEALEETLASLSPPDLDRTITIRSEPHTVSRALIRSLAHTAGHVHQIILLCRHWMGPDWQTISVPRGASKAFEQRMRDRFAR